MFPIFDEPPFNVAAGLFPGPVDGGRQALVAVLLGAAVANGEIRVPGGLRLVVETTVSAAPVLALMLHPDREPVLRAGPFVDGGTPIEGAITATLHLVEWHDERAEIFSLPPVSLGIQGAFARARIVGGTNGADLAAEIGIRGGRVTLGGQQDGFFSRFLPAGGVSLEFDAALGWSLRRGVYLAGGAGLSTSFPLNRRLGPLTIESLELAIAPTDSLVRCDATISGAVEIGPVEITFGGLGSSVQLSRTGDLGIGGLTVDGRLPDRLGLSVDTQTIQGAGWIERDEAGGRYLGGLWLQIAGVRGSAVGLLETRGAGYSLAVLAQATFPPVPLVLGFYLDGLGAFVGLHRRLDVDATREGLRSGALSGLLLESGEPSGAARAVEALSSFFPRANGRHLVGPVARIGWGVPKVFLADVALLLELPAPVRIALLATAELGLPSLSKRVVDIRVDLLGVLDFERSTLALDASLHHSKIAGYPLTGDMALRIGWGDDPHFLLAIGGFHPRFTPPPGFPALRRLALTAGDNPQFRLEAYLALTSNTAQVGAHADLTYSGSGFDINGHLGFDALFEFVPFHFEVDITASASISYHGHNLASVELAFLLTGPRPWHATGHATFSIWRWDHSVDFDATWGNATPASLPPPPDAAAALRDALEQPEAWIAELPAGEPSWIAFAAPAALDGSVHIHPLAELTVRQRAMPLDYDITQFGNIPLPSPRRFSIEEVRIGGETVAAVTVEDRFARGQFTRLSVEQRLSAPSFEQFHAGVRFGADEVRLGPTARAAMYTDTVLDDPLAPPAPPPRVTIPAWIVAHATAVRAGRSAPPPPRTGPRVKDLEFALASTEDLSITALGAAIGRGARTYGALREALNRYIAETGRRPPLQVVPRVEVSNGKARVVVVREDDQMRNLDFVDTETGRPMSRAQFVDAISAGDYPDHVVKMVHGLPTPVSRPNAAVDDNLG